MSLFKRILSLCLCLVLLGGFCAAPLQSLAAEAARSSAFAGIKGPTLVKQDGIWYYVKNGAVCYDTTLVKFNGAWWYVSKGQIIEFTTLVYFNGAWWYVKNGKVASNTTTLVQYSGSWWYVKNGKVASNITTLVKHNGVWWYVKNGKVAFNTTTLVKYNGAWWYVKNGKVASDTTTLVQFNGAWWYVKNGKVASDTTTLIKQNGSWWYVRNGKIATSTTTLVKFNNEWWYVVNGKVNSTVTSMVRYNNEWWYVVKGKIAAATTALVKYDGQWYYVVKGKMAGATTGLVQYNGSWWYIKNGKLDTEATALVPHNGALWYVKNGKLDTTTTGMVPHDGKQYYVTGGKVNTSTTSLVLYNGQWYYIKDGSTQPNATTLVEYDGQLRYVLNGVYTPATTFCTYNGQDYYVKGGVAQTALSGKVVHKGFTYFLRNGIRTDCHLVGHTNQERTCTADESCTKCTYVTTPAFGHSWTKGTCTRCGVESDKRVTLKVWVPDEDLDWLAELEAAFEEAYPEYGITWENTACASGEAYGRMLDDPNTVPDVYLFSNDQLGGLTSHGMISSLEGAALAQVQADNGEVLLNTVTDKDGKVYGFPVSNNTWFMYYNKEIFTEEDVKSLDTMLEKGVVAFPWGISWYNGTFFLANGGTIFGADSNDAAAGVQFGSANGGYEAARKMVQLASNPNFRDDVNQLGIAGLKNGTVGACFTGAWDADSLREALGDKLGAAQLPTVQIGGEEKQMKAFAASHVIGVHPGTADPEMAMLLAAFLSTPAAQKARYESNGTIPATHALAEDPLISSDCVAMAEINTMRNTSVLQPVIPEMNRYWRPIADFCNRISSGVLTEDNCDEAVDLLMMELAGTAGDSLGAGEIDSAKQINVKLHYERQDGNYDGWNVWMWDPDNHSPLTPPFTLQEENGEMVANVWVHSGTDKLGYIVRYRDWEGKDVDEDQFIDLYGISSGTVHVYVKSGIRGHEMVVDDEVLQGAYSGFAQYQPEGADGEPRLVIRIIDLTDEAVSVTVNGEAIPIIGTTAVEDYYFLKLGSEIPAGSIYTVTIGEHSFSYTMK